MKAQKKGFTLIELMVVIVIIGILAAIAIPKLFGMSAKAKASEVGPAAGTWSKLQQAYITETSGLGDGVDIGYTPPGANKSGNTGSSTNFYYSLARTGDAPASEASWTAKNISKLNDCDADSPWQVTGTLNGNAADYEIKIGTEDVKNKTASGDCGSLTPNFGRLQ